MGDPFKLIIEDDEGKRNVVPVAPASSEIASPHCRHSAESIRFHVWQAEQAIWRGEPHMEQKRASTELSLPHDWQRISSPFVEAYRPYT